MMSATLGDLAVPPGPLTPTEKHVAAVVAGVVAVTRWFALSRTLWDWDESLFMLALRHYNVVEHHPHPPGFPLFIAAAKLFTLAGFDAFHALQAVNLVAAVAIVPAMLFLGRELRAGFPVSIIAAIFLAFFPNVWFFGGTAFSDVPSMVLAMLSVALLLRGCRDPGAFFLGAAVLGIAAGFRPQNLVIGLVPAVLAAWFQWRRRWTHPLVAFLIVSAVVFVSYGVAVSLSGGWDVYRGAVKLHEQYIAQTDSFRSPLRPPLHLLVVEFFMRMPAINTILMALVATSIVSFVRLRLHAWVILLSFGPFCILAWLLLDHFSASRFSIGYAPLIALLAADGLDVACSAASALSRGAMDGRPGLVTFREAESALAAVVTIVMIGWTLPALREVRAHLSPPFEAMQWIRANVDRRTATLYVHEGMQPYAEELLPDYSVRYVMEGQALTAWMTHDRSLFVKEGASVAPEGHLFSRPRGRLWQIVRQRYFEVSVLPMSEVVDFRDGWYQEEGTSEHVWRWMGRRGVVMLPRLRDRARLRLRFYVPLDALHAEPTVTVSLNGAVLDRYHAVTKEVERSYDVIPRDQAPNELVIETDRIVNPAAEHLNADARDLGLRLETYDWRTR
jgi:hypothetical protein